MTGDDRRVGSPHHLFVYGTLRPGDVRWHFLEPWVVDAGRDDSVRGRLFDTGLGYPAAMFGDGGIILGRTYELARATLGRALRTIDDEESSVAGGYHRVLVDTRTGVSAWAYAYGGGLELAAIPGGDWTAR